MPVRFNSHALKHDVAASAVTSGLAVWLTAPDRGNLCNTVVLRRFGPAAKRLLDDMRIKIYRGSDAEITMSDMAIAVVDYGDVYI